MSKKRVASIMVRWTYVFLLAGSLFFCNTLPAFAKMLDGATILQMSHTDNICAITFDDGPSHLTEKVLDALKVEDVKATFFVLGEQVLRYPQALQRMAQEGHEVANHSFDHADLSTLSAEAVHKDMQKVNALLEELGVAVRHFRPPYGRYNATVVNAAANLGMDTVLWSTDSRDWELYPDYGNMPNVFGRPLSPEKMRGIFLFHETKQRTARDIRIIVTVLRAVGCQRFVTVSEYIDIASSLIPPHLTAEQEPPTSAPLAQKSMAIDIPNPFFSLRIQNGGLLPSSPQKKITLGMSDLTCTPCLSSDKSTATLSLVPPLPPLSSMKTDSLPSTAFAWRNDNPLHMGPLKKIDFVLFKNSRIQKQENTGVVHY